VNRLQAPKGDRAILAAPFLEHVPHLVEANRQRRARASGQLLGRAFQELRRQAQASVVAAASDYLQQAGEPVPPGQPDSLLLAGHQPELFHPGVWIKNFALNRLARQTGATPINLIVDNDAVKATSLHVPGLRVPARPLEEHLPNLLFLPFDHGLSDAPYEERPVLDEAFFSSFPERVPQEWGFTPLLNEFWAEVRRQGQRTPLLGERFSAARRSYERRWGCHNLEIPIGRLCDTEPYGWFLLHLLAELPRFLELHNRTVQEYRHRYGLRSKNHPVPDLTRDGDWLEAPFWSWRAGGQRRAHLFARVRPDAIELRSGADRWPALPWGDGQAPEKALLVWQQMRAAGYKIRSRALTNTLYARVFLGDLFIHGIGGGKYDELTDQLINGFYGLEPPGYLVLSGTLLLPLPRYPTTRADCCRLCRRWRDLRYNPQRHLDEAGIQDGPAGELVREKEYWIHKRYHGRQERLERFDRLRAITDQLRTYLTEQERATKQQWQQCLLQVEANAVLNRRDYAFCLFPEAVLRSFCTQFL
jgi:hypothetical protein